MKHLKLIFITFLSISIFVSCSSDDTVNIDPETLSPLEAYEEFDIAYGSDSEQVFDLYLPPNRNSDTKIIILVHGGGWTSGDKTDMADIAEIIKLQLPNYAIANINYRLADEDNFAYPMQINDITSVVDYLENNQDIYTISDDIGFIGASAGAHLSMLWSYAFDTESQVDMVCSIVGPTNFTDPAYLDNPVFQELSSAFGITLTIDFLEEMSPYHRVTSSAPPTILFYGGEDPLIPSSQGMDMSDILQELNVTHEFNFYPSEGHGWGGANWIDSVIRLKGFIETHM
ncbi:alpha/beta hydrolase [Winogradskyella flava]|uniref:Alpha/beta hydrolase n=1 Tax=Winogradskyella flava TaxID=1884876 RepID=A0A842J161_9FLAO|nr:alpha/beta hydrolase [Winogradskyella flava]MBC2846708.1 alpha/beta hydrolase [Winogradskyella flava]